MRAFIIAAIFALSACGAPPAEKSQTAPKEEARAPAPQFETTELAGNFFVGVASANIGPAAYPDLAREACGSRSFCKVGIWTDPERLPRGFPMTDREVGAQIFMYSLNRETGFEQTLWNCQVVPQSDPANCGLGPA